MLYFYLYFSLCMELHHVFQIFHYFQVEIDYVQCSDLDIDAIFDPTVANPIADQESVPEPIKQCLIQMK